MERRDFELRTAGGRKLTGQVAGPEDGALVLFHHGTPGPRQIFERQLRECAERGLRHACYRRPGYHDSERHPGRTIADCVADAAAVADALGAEAFHNVGYSGGGPHALAVSALLPDRVLTTTTFGSVAPPYGEGLDWMAGAGGGEPGGVRRGRGGGGCTGGLPARCARGDEHGRASRGRRRRPR